MATTMNMTATTEADLKSAQAAPGAQAQNVNHCLETQYVEMQCVVV